MHIYTMTSNHIHQLTAIPIATIPVLSTLLFACGDVFLLNTFLLLVCLVFLFLLLHVVYFLFLPWTIQADSLIIASCNRVLLTDKGIPIKVKFGLDHHFSAAVLSVHMSLCV